ncbi:MAG: preprotein translocase subunit SecG [Oscillospiraceae bacterium]|nr:preprotein translocase subunit SecG [Oscillospiraceae bacterium]
MSEVFILKIALAIAQIVLSVALVFVVLLQQSRRQGLSGAISGAADTFLSKNKAKSFDAMLAKITVVVAVIFLVVTLVLNLSFMA